MTPAGENVESIDLAGGHAWPARRAREVAPAAGFWLAVLANGGVTVWLWLHGGGVSAVHGWGDAMTSIGRITGLLGAGSALVQVLLLARLPWLERLSGFDRLTVWHRLNGKICLLLVLAHVVFITLGYAAMDRLSVPSEISQLLSSYPGMITATVGTALLLVVVVSSLVIVRRRLRYEAWYAVHLTAYAAIALAWFHQIPTGNELTVDPTAADYWRSLYLATLALLIAGRIAQPALRALRHRLYVAEVVPEGPGVVSMRIAGRRLEELHARSGQFFLWRFLSRRGCWWQAHPFSLSAAPADRSLRITVKHAGDFTSRIAAIEPGTRVIAEGPFGAFTSAARRRERVALIAGGIGITPVRALLEELRGPVTVVYRVLRAEDVVFRDELDELARRNGAEIHYVIGDHAAPGGEQLLSPQHLHELIPDLVDRDVFVCGPPAMTEAIERNLRRAGVPRRHIRLERFAL